jgi:EmrB/QacA subfamily drug resistance transporter
MTEHQARPSTAHGPVPDPADGHSYLSHRQILVVLSGLMAGMLLAALDQSIVGTALPRIVSDIGGLDQLAWVVTAYLLTSTASTPLWGKISDLYGRRPMFQAAIGTFLVGSVLSALSQNIIELVAFRAVQGIGGGGLMALAFAVVGDIIPPRERGRYQGYFGVVFGVSSVAGPLLGGWFTDGPGWRWIFWINLPIGLAALVVTSWALRLPKVRRNHQIDYLGAATIVAAISSLLLYLSWRGVEYGWTEPWALALLGSSVVLTLLFVWIESRAAEPIIPLRLFRNPVFSVSNAFGLLTGFVMFGMIVYLPFYLQVVKGMSPTVSGLAMLPMVAGIFSTSISSGQLITRTGRYKIYPVVGGAVIAFGVWLLSRLHADSTMWTVGVYAYVVGLGLGLTMATVMTAVQNSVEMRDMGTATSSLTFFRSMGGAIGTAMFGAILTSRLSVHLAELLPGGAAARVPDGATDNVSAIQQLPPAIKEPVVEAFVRSLHDVYLAGIPLAIAAFVVVLFLKELPLRTGRGAPESSQAVEAPAPGPVPEFGVNGKGPVASNGQPAPNGRADHNGNAPSPDGRATSNGQRRAEVSDETRH